MPKIYTLRNGDKKIQTTHLVLEQIPYFRDKLNNQTEFELNLDFSNLVQILDYVRFPSKSFPVNACEEAKRLGFCFDISEETNSDLVKINVGGEIFMENKSFLIKTQYFQPLLSGRWNIDDEIFLDMNPNAFREILNHLKDSTYSIPVEYQAETDMLGIYFISDDITEENTKPECLQNRIASSQDYVDHPVDIMEYYTKSPEITFFRLTPRRCTNFVKNYYQQQIKADFETPIEIVIPFEISMVSYFLFQFKFQFELFGGILTLADLKWINHIESHIFEDVSIYYGKSHIKTITGEYLLVEKINNQINYSNNITELIVPFIHFTYDTIIAISNGKPGHEIRLVVKLRSWKKLLQINKEIGEVNIENFVKCKLIQSVFHVVYPVLTSDEQRKFNDVHHETFISTQKTFIQPISAENKQSISLNYEFGLKSIHLYLREKNGLIPIDNHQIKKIEFMDGIQLPDFSNGHQLQNFNIDLPKFSLDRTVLTKIHEVDTQVVGNQYNSADADKKLSGAKINELSNIINYYFCLYGKKSIIVPPTNLARCIIYFHDNHELEGKEIVVVCSGEDILRIVNSISHWSTSPSYTLTFRQPKFQPSSRNN